jgi:hypothetical protein
LGSWKRLLLWLEKVLRVRIIKLNYRRDFDAFQSISWVIRIPWIWDLYFNPVLTYFGLPLFICPTYLRKIFTPSNSEIFSITKYVSEDAEYQPVESLN